MASRKMARSIAERRSKRQFCACLTMTSSSEATSRAAPSNKRLANARVVSAAFASRQNLASSFAGSCLLMSHWKSICMANSRALVRRDTLLSTRLSGWRYFRGCRAQFAGEVGHLDGGKAGLKSLIATLEAGAIDGLLEGVAGKHAKNDRQAGVDLSELQATGGLGAHVIVMGCVAAEDAADGDESIVLAGGGKFFGGQRQLKRTGHMHDVNAAAGGAGAFERIESGSEEPIGDEAIEAAHDDGKPKTRGGQCAADGAVLELV